MKENINTLFFLRRKPDYQNTLNWANDPEETILLTWDIKLIANDWLTPTIYFTAGISVLLVPFIIALFLKSPLTNMESAIFGGGLYGFFASFILLQVRVKNQFVYRLSDVGIEYHRWRVCPELICLTLYGNNTKTFT